jgi:hypothetical protein
MTHEQIEELFIAAANVDRRLPSSGERQANLKAQAIPYYHTKADVSGWGAERYAEERADFLSSRTTRLKTSDVSKWELCNELMAFVPKDEYRKALWAWAMSEAGTLRAPKLIDGEIIMVKASFSRWCHVVMKVHRNTGTRRKNAAIACISSIFLRNTLKDIRKLQKEVLQKPAETMHKSINIAAPRHWHDQDMIADRIAQTEKYREETFSWAKWRNEQRREREKSRQAA